MNAIELVSVTTLVMTLLYFIGRRLPRRPARAPQRSFCGKEDPNSYFSCSKPYGHDDGEHAVVVLEHTHRWRN